MKRLNPFATIELVADPDMVERTFVRVRGGHMNRWWIRVEVVKPNPHPRIHNGRLYTHPDVLDRIRKELRA